MRPDRIFQCFRSDSDKQQVPAANVRFSVEVINFFIENGKILLEERISLFDGRNNPIRCFSVDDLNSMNVNNRPYVKYGCYNIHAGVWDGNSVMVKCSPDSFDGTIRREQACREIAVSTQMGTHGNAHRLLGFCLVTKHPVLVYAWAENGTLEDRVLKYTEQGKEALEWNNRLRIASEIANVVAYLHTAFSTPIIHRDLKPTVVFLDQDDSARLSDFSLAISIPKGEKDVEDSIRGTVAFVAPEYVASGSLAESADVFSFGVLLLVLLTGKLAFELNNDMRLLLLSWVRDCHAANNLGDIVDPTITRDGSVAGEHFENYLQEFVELALRCSSNEPEHRPTMVELAIELENMILLTPHSL